MKKSILTIGLILILTIGLLVLTGCGSKDEGIIGSWAYGSGDYVYTFNTDKTGSYNAFGTEMNFTYEDDGSSVSILYTGNTAASTYAYRIEGNKLIIKDSFGYDVEYVKK